VLMLGGESSGTEGYVMFVLDVMVFSKSS
jgi:hypothetical protein